MMKLSSNWRFIFGIFFLIVFFFSWGNEIFDLPHILLGASNTPVNLEESILETIFFTIFSVASYRIIVLYEKRWLGTLNKVQELASIDVLTGALNRREFIEKANMEFSRSVRSNVPFVLTLVDFDDFKGVNDHFGHLCGDKVLIEFVQVVKRHIRQHDLIGRLGGDEFGIVLTGASQNVATETLQRIAHTWNTSEILSDEGQRISVSVSMGATAWKKQDRFLEDVIRRADRLLYMAKDAGRNRIEVG